MKKKHVNAVLAVMCVVTVLIGTMAYFTDRVNASTTATAGTLDLQISNVTPNAPVTKFRPGKGIAISYTLTNAGSKSADVEETLLLSSSIAMTGDNTPTVAEFELYAAANVALDANGYVTSITGEPLAVRTFDETSKKEIKYVLEDFVLNGTGGNAEIEAEANGQNSKTCNYVLVFKPAAGNTYQDADVKLEILAQAKQHRNTNDDTWTEMKKLDFAFDSGTSVKAVPELTA